MEPGLILGKRYRILRRLGEGATAIVYKAEDIKLHRFVTIKVLKKELNENEEFVKRFKTEASAVATLSHTNVGMIYDVYDEKNLHCIIMEYISGRTLKAIIEKEAPFDESRIINYALQILEGLGAAHTHHVIHRDIKPENILVTDDGVLKIRDFGVAQAATTSTVVLNGDAVGSVHYFSPEQAKGRPVNESSDLYALGIIIFEMATKRLPFESDNHVTVAVKHIHDPVPDPRDYNESISTALVNIINKSTQKASGLRFQNAAEMSTALKEALANPNDLAHVETSLSQALVTDNDKNVTQIEQTKKTKKTKKFSLFGKSLATILGVLLALGLSMGFLAVYLFIEPTASAETEKLIAVPNLVGKTLEEATDIANSKSFNVIKVGEKETTRMKSGTVLEQIPAINMTATKNSTIELVIAKTPQKTTVIVPDVVGYNVAQAQEIIENTGLYSVITREFSEYIEIGSVVNQLPKGQSTAQKFDVVELIVSLGKEIPYVIMPDLHNLTLEQATNTLAAYQLRLGVVTEEISNTPKGLVLSQDLLPNTNVDPDAAINIVVSLGPVIEKTDDNGVFFELEQFLKNLVKNQSEEETILEFQKKIQEDTDEALKAEKAYINAQEDALEAAQKSIEANKIQAQAEEELRKIEDIISKLKADANSSDDDIKETEKKLDDAEDTMKKAEKAANKAENAAEKTDKEFQEAKEEAIQKAAELQHTQEDIIREQESLKQLNTALILPAETLLEVKPYTIKLPESLKTNTGKLTYHVIVTFNTNQGEQTLFNKNIKKNEFPYTIELTGSGTGVLSVYFDSLERWKEEFKF